MSEKVEGHGGQLALAGLKPFGVTELFTLSGGHIFPLYDAARSDDVRIIDVRHEQSAVFAAEAVAKLQRRPGLAVLTAGPGVTNGVSAITSAYFNGAPVVVLGGRAPLFRWGAGSLQEIDHVPLIAPVTKHAATVNAADDLTEALHAAARTALSPHRGPVFLDLPLDVVFNTGTGTVPADSTVDIVEPDPEDIFKAAALLAAAQRPVIIAGSDVYAGDATAALREAAESLQIPVFTNGMGRGSLPAGHPLAFTKARRAALQGADVVAVIGTPLDFRLNFGEFGEAQVVHIVDAPSQRASHITPAVSPAGDLRLILSTIADHRGVRAEHADWVESLRAVEDAALAAQTAELEADTDPIKPGRVYGELRKILEPDAVTIGDGGDFVSYAGRYLEPSRPGTWLDPGPYGCLGTGMGYAIGARATYPDRQICVLLGDGAAGFSLMDVETLVRHKMPVVIVCGNNGIWGLEKHPMQALYGYDVAADLQPGLRYDAVVAALGGAGETVSKPAAIAPALSRAFDAGVPYLVNVLTDPADQYPRSSNLA
jgi:acetolactate synthase-1/2/3 large subunit